MSTWLTAPWPWYIAGPIIGLFVPALLLAGNRVFGISSNLRHLCSAFAPGKLEYFRYDWKNAGLPGNWIPSKAMCKHQIDHEFTRCFPNCVVRRFRR